MAKTGVAQNIARGIASGKSPNQATANTVNPFDEMYQNAISQAGGDVELQKAIIRQMNKRIMQTDTNYDEPLWNKTQEELDNLTLGRPEVYVDYPDVPAETTANLPDAQPQADKVTDVNEQVKQEYPTPTEMQMPVDKLGLNKGDTVTLNESLPSVRIKLPNGEWQTYEAKKFDKSGDPVFIPQKKGQTLWDEWSTYSMNLFLNKRWKDKQDYFNMRQDAEYRAKEKAQKKESTGYERAMNVTPDVNVDVSETDIQKEMSKVAFGNSMKSVGRYVMNLLDMTVGAPAYLLERMAGTAMIMTAANKDTKSVNDWLPDNVADKKTQDEYAKLKASTNEDITLDEAWQASRLAFDTMGSGSVIINEFIREYRENPDADPAEIQMLKENIWADLAGQVFLDPLNLIGKANKVTKALDKTGQLAADPALMKMINKLKGVADSGVVSKLDDIVEDIVPKVDNVIEDVVSKSDNVIQDTIRTIDKSTPAAERAGIAARNAELGKAKLDELRVALKDLKKTGTPEEIAKLTKQAEQAGKTMGRWNREAKMFASAAEAAGQLQNKADDVLKALIDIPTGNPASKIPSPKVSTVTDEMMKLTQDVIKRVDNAKAELKGIGASLWKTGKYKHALVTGDIKDILRLVSVMNNPKDAGAVLHALTILAGDADEAVKAKALAHILANPSAINILSPAGLRVGAVLSDMMTYNALKKIPEIIGEVRKAQDPLITVTTLLEGKSSLLLDKYFPTVNKRIEYASKIQDLIDAGKPIPKYLERYMVDGKPENFSGYVKTFVDLHDKIQHKLLFGRVGIADVNRVMSEIFIVDNPAAQVRNAISDTTTAAVDGYIPGFNYQKTWDKYAGLMPSQADSGIGLESSVQEITQSKNKVQNWITNLSQNAERARARGVIAQALDNAMESQYKVMFNDLRGDLLAYGIKEADVTKLEKLISEMGVEKGFETMFNINGSRNISDVLDDDAIKGLHELGLDDKVNDIIRNNSSEDAYRKIQETLSDFSKEAGKADKEPLLVNPDSPAFDEIADIADSYVATNDYQGFDLINRLSQARYENLTNSLDTVKTLQTKIQQFVREQIKAGEIVDEKAYDAVIDGLRNIENKSQKIKNDAVLELKKLLQPIYDEANKFKPGTPENLAKQMDAKALRAGYWEDIINKQIKLINDDFDTLTKGIDIPEIKRSKDKLIKLAENVDKYNNIDEVEFLSSGMLKTLEGELLKNPVGDMYMSASRALKEAEPKVVETFDKILNSLEDIYSKVPPEINADQLAALQEFKGIVKGRYVEALSKSWEYANNVRIFTMLDYNRKTTGDLLAAYVFPFQFWYSRSYKNWMSRIMDNPGLAAHYAKFRQAQEKQSSGMPDWYKYQINFGSMFGLPADNPLTFNLEQLINPLNGITGVDFEDRRKLRDGFPALIDQIGKYGPSPHTLFSYAIAAYYGMTGEKDMADAWMSRMIPITKPIRDFSGVAMSALGLEGGGTGTPIDNLITPGGIEVDPMVALFMGGLDPYEKRKVERKLAEMVQRGDIIDGKPIDPELAMEAAKDQSGELWNKAWEYMQNDPELPWFMRKSILQGVGGLAGLGLKGRTKEDILTDKFYQEYYMLRGVQNNLSPSEYKVRLTQLFERYPQGEFILLAGKNDTYRDQAYNYNVLNRIPPGQLSDYSNSYGMDSELINKFYETKGRTDLWSASDRQRFDSFILDVAMSFEIPPTALKHEFDSARIRNSQLNEYLQKQYGADILDKMNALYDIEASGTGRDAYLNANPDVTQALEERYQNIVADPMLNKYYGGIDKLKMYYEYQKRGEAQALFGVDIFKTIAQYQYVKDSKKDIAGFKEDHPEVDKYYDWNAEQQKLIEKKIEEWSKTLPETPQAIANPEAKMESVGQIDLLNYLKENDANADMETDLAKYNTPAKQEDLTTEFSFTKSVDERAEKKWPGIVDRWKKWEAATVNNPEAAARMWNNDPTISQYNFLLRGLQAQRAEAKNGQQIQSENIMRQMVQQSLSPELYRLAIDITRGADESPSVKKQLAKIAKQLGITYNQLMMYVIQ